MLTPKAYQQAKTLLLTSAVAGAGVVMTLLIGYVMASPTFGWTGAPWCDCRCSVPIGGLVRVPHVMSVVTLTTYRRHHILSQPDWFVHLPTPYHGKPRLSIPDSLQVPAGYRWPCSCTVFGCITHASGACN